MNSDNGYRVISLIKNLAVFLKEEENNATDCQGKEQIKTVAHVALEETQTGSISPPDPPKPFVIIRLKIKHSLAAESEQHRLVNMTWP